MGTSSTQTVQHVWVNHDTDLLDVTLHSAGHDTHTRPGTSEAKQRAVALRAHGLRAPPAGGPAADQADLARSGVDATTVAAAPATEAPGAAVARDETIHTTANHPWLTADRGWVPAGELRMGEQVVELGGRTATVTALAVRPGAATYYNLTVSQLHTYAVGKTRAVVHNTGPACTGGLYRGDSRSTDDIFTNGFKPKGSDTDLTNHLMSKLEDTAYVSTSKSMEVAGIYAAGYDGYVYKVVASGEDVNALMERGLYTFNKGFAWEQEVAVLGGIPNSNVVGAWKVIGGDGVLEELRLGPFIPNPFFAS